MSNYTIQPYSKNKRYYNLLIIAAVLLVISNFVIINCFQNYLDFIGKTWELISSVLVIAVTYLYWFVERKSENGDLSGKEIIDKITDNSKKKLVEKLVKISNVLLIIVALANFILILISKDNHWIGASSVLLVAIVFFLYCWIGDTVVDVLAEMKLDSTINGKEKENITKVHSNVLSGYKFADVPVFITFTILTVFAFLFCAQIDLLPQAGFDYSHIKLFFSGATGFQLIFSAVTWANV